MIFIGVSVCQGWGEAWGGGGGGDIIPRRPA